MMPLKLVKRKTKPTPPKRGQGSKSRPKAVAPACPDNCQVNHNIQQTAALLQTSPWQVRQLIKLGKLEVLNVGTGELKKYLRVPHPSIRKLLLVSGKIS